MFPIDFQNSRVSTNVSTNVSLLSADLRNDFDFKQCSFLRLRSANTEFPMLASGAPVFRRGEASAELRRGEKENEERVRREMAEAEGRTLYKRKGKKVLPADVGYDNGKNQRGMRNGEKRGRRRNGMRPEDDSQNSSFRSFRRSGGDPD